MSSAREEAAQPQPAVIVRDFAFAASDPRFHGRPLPKPAGGADLPVGAGRFRSGGGGGTASASASASAGGGAGGAASASSLPTSSSAPGGAVTAAAEATHAADRPSDDESEDHGDGTTERLFDSDDSDDGASDDGAGSHWSWIWTSRMAAAIAARAARAKPANVAAAANTTHQKSLLPLIKAKDFDAFILPALLVHFGRHATAADTPAAPKASSEPSQHAQTQPTAAVCKTPQRVWRVRAIFPFSKANDCEMSLESGDELIVVSFSPASKPDADAEQDPSKWSESDPVADTAVAAVATDKPKASTQPLASTQQQKLGIGERWSSIDDALDDDNDVQTGDQLDRSGTLLSASSASTKTSGTTTINDTIQQYDATDSTNTALRPTTITQDDTLTLDFEPPVSDFIREIHQFVAFHDRYGSSWLLALKVRIKGGWADTAASDATHHTGRSGNVKVQLRDLGLVPGNYVEPQ